IAASTVLKMVQKINELDQSSNSLDTRNSFVRMVWTKEEHARKCKEELLILWTDYFKSEHFEKYPDLTDKILAACKLCSQNKQSIDEASAQELVKAVDEIADIFESTKKA
ncbi:superoxide dismutase, Ni, partial [Candidatus Daviesbacteria bacterium]|nr:superoxide dismutase, Ni [Candidatus Daviesbacteria bacterium]